MVNSQVHTGWLDSRIASKVHATQPAWHLAVIAGAIVSGGDGGSQNLAWLFDRALSPRLLRPLSVFYKVGGEFHFPIPICTCLRTPSPASAHLHLPQQGQPGASGPLKKPRQQGCQQAALLARGASFCVCASANALYVRIEMTAWHICAVGLGIYIQVHHFIYLQANASLEPRCQHQSECSSLAFSSMFLLSPSGSSKVAEHLHFVVAGMHLGQSLIFLACTACVGVQVRTHQAVSTQAAEYQSDLAKGQTPSPSLSLTRHSETLIVGGSVVGMRVG